MSDEQLLIEFDLSGASLYVLEIMCDDAADESVFQDIYKANLARPDVLKLLYDHPNTPEDLMKEVAAVLVLPPKEHPGTAHSPAAHEEADKKEELVRGEDGELRTKKAETLLQKIKKLTVGERVALAVKGGKEVRGILLKDSAKEVVKKVMENPKMTESEVEMITKNRSISEDVLRIISKRKEWMKNYSIMSGLITNPKTPGGIAMQYVKFLSLKDLDLVQKNKNVSEAVRITAKKLLSQKKPH